MVIFPLEFPAVVVVYTYIRLPDCMESRVMFMLSVVGNSNEPIPPPPISCLAF
jgi:hypothetical protein